jgi:hypothetical protein
MGRDMFTANPTTSGQFNFNPSCAEIIVNAFSRIQVRRTEILQAHLQDALSEFNFMLAQFDNAGPNLWTVDKQVISLAQGTATYAILGTTITILDAYLTIGTATTPATDRLMFPISRTEYAALPNKLSQSTPTQFWFDRLISPTITVYPAPDGNGPYKLNYFRYRQIQDAVVAGGLQAEVPVRWLDALIAGLSYRLSRIYAPALENTRKMDAMEAWNNAAKQDTEATPLYITPALGGYFR